MPTMRRPLLPQRAREGSNHEEKAGRARSRQSAAKSRGGVCARKAEEGGGGTRGHAARHGGQEGARRYRGDPDAHRFTALAPEAHPQQRRHRADKPRDKAEDEGRRDLPGRQLRPHARDGEAEICRRA